MPKSCCYCCWHTPCNLLTHSLAHPHPTALFLCLSPSLFLLSERVLFCFFFFLLREKKILCLCLSESYCGCACYTIFGRKSLGTKQTVSWMEQTPGWLFSFALLWAPFFPLSSLTCICAYHWHSALSPILFFHLLFIFLTPAFPLLSLFCLHPLPLPLPQMCMHI